MKSVKLPGSQWWYSVFLEFYKSFQPSGYLKLLVFKCWPLLKARVVKIELRKFEFRSFTILTWSCWRLLRWKEAKSSRYRAQRSQTLKDFTVVRTVINFMSRKNHRWKFFASISPPTWPSWHYKQGKIFHFVLCLFDRISSGTDITDVVHLSDVNDLPNQVLYNPSHAAYMLCYFGFNLVSIWVGLWPQCSKKLE